MQMTRRQALTLVAATVATPALSAPRRISLRPEAVETTVVGRRLPMPAFNGHVPGPEIRLRQGNAVHIRLDTMGWTTGPWCIGKGCACTIAWTA